MAENIVHRFFGGSPLGALARLVVVSFAVGAVLYWLDIEPFDMIRAAERLARQIWFMGFDAVRQAGHYVLAGALIVVPIWLLARLFSFRRAR